MTKEISKEDRNFAELLKISTEKQKNAFELVMIGMELQKSIDNSEKISA